VPFQQFIPLWRGVRGVLWVYYFFGNSSPIPGVVKIRFFVGLKIDPVGLKKNNLLDSLTINNFHPPPIPPLSKGREIFSSLFLIFQKINWL
jgi:hypothetical protein